MSDGKAAIRPVAIVGGGFSGTMTAVQLARRGVPSVLIDGSGRMGRGVAYATREPVHLLNVITEKMSAWPDRPRDFADWCGDDGTGFVERRLFGDYLAQQLAAAGDLVTHLDSFVAGASRMEGGWQLRLGGGEALDASALVLANGNQPPLPFAGTETLPAALFVNDPWGPEAEAAISRAAAEQSDVLILGTSLTMVDTVLSLVAAGHEGRITAVSRRGLLPRAHVDPPAAPAPVTLDQVPLGNVVALWRWLRHRAAEVGFRAAVDSLRPHSHAIWRSFPQAERQRLLRHAAPWWGAHRHRIAPAVARQLRELIEAGRLEIVAGRIGSFGVEGDGLSATIARRTGGERRVHATLAFNCTGPLGNIRNTRDPLLRQLLDAGLVVADPLGIGLEVDEGARAGERLWALGPLTKGMYWEITAVPDIRGQAEGVAEAIAKELLPHG